MHAKDYALQQLETAKFKYQTDHMSVRIRNKKQREKQLKERAIIKKQRDESRRRLQIREKMKHDLINKVKVCLNQ